MQQQQLADATTPDAVSVNDATRWLHYIITATATATATAIAKPRLDNDADASVTSLSGLLFFPSSSTHFYVDARRSSSDARRQACVHSMVLGFELVLSVHGTSSGDLGKGAYLSL